LAAIHDFYKTADYADVTDGNMFLATYSLRVLEFGAAAPLLAGLSKRSSKCLGMFTLDLAAFSPGEILCFSIRGIRDIRWSSANFSFFCGPKTRKKAKIDKI
jgi:hypothetical protein